MEREDYFFEVDENKSIRKVFVLIIYDIVDVVEERAKLHQAIIKDKRFNDNLYLLPAAQNADKNDVNGQQMIEIVAELKKEYDYV